MLHISREFWFLPVLAKEGVEEIISKFYYLVFRFFRERYKRQRGRDGTLVVLGARASASAQLGEHYPNSNPPKQVGFRRGSEGSFVPWIIIFAKFHEKGGVHIVHITTKESQRAREMARVHRALVVATLLALAATTAYAQEPPVGKGYTSHEERLRSRLFGGINAAVIKSTLPKNATSPAVNVAVGVYFYSLGQLDELAGTVSMSLWQRMAWKDSNLVWNPADFGKGGGRGRRYNSSRKLFNSTTRLLMLLDNAILNALYSYRFVLVSYRTRITRVILGQTHAAVYRRRALRGRGVVLCCLCVRWTWWWWRWRVVVGRMVQNTFS